MSVGGWSTPRPSAASCCEPRGRRSASKSWSTRRSPPPPSGSPIPDSWGPSCHSGSCAARPSPRRRCGFYNGAVSDASRRDLEIEAIFARLRAEVVEGGTGFRRADSAPPVLQSRRQLDRLWAVSADRPFLTRPGGWGRLRAALLLPAKWVLRKLMRWYVEPLAADQRAFNAAVMRAFDEQAAWIQGELDRLERQSQDSSSSPPV